MEEILVSKEWRGLKYLKEGYKKEWDRLLSRVCRDRTRKIFFVLTGSEAPIGCPER